MKEFYKSVGEYREMLLKYPLFLSEIEKTGFDINSDTDMRDFMNACLREQCTDDVKVYIDQDGNFVQEFTVDGERLRMYTKDGKPVFNGMDVLNIISDDNVAHCGNETIN